MANTVITIGRQFGSGGHEVGMKLAEALNINFYDKELLAIVAEKTGLHEDYIKQNEETPSNMFSGESVVFGYNSMYYQVSGTDKVFMEQLHVIKELADKESCVIVGRCSDYILRDNNSINIFISAPIADRVQRKLRLQSDNERLDADKMEKEIYKIDKQRAKYYKFHTDRMWGDSTNYHLCIDTGKVGIEGAVNTIITYLRNIKP